MEDKELQEIKSLALSYGDPIRGKILALVASVEAFKKHATDFEELYKQEHRQTNLYKKALQKIVCSNIEMPDVIFNIANDALDAHE